MLPSDEKVFERQLENVRCEKVKKAVRECLTDEHKDQADISNQYRHLLDAMTIAAKEYARTQNIGPDNFAVGVLYHSMSIVRDFRQALVESPWDADRRPMLDFWQHARFPIDKIRREKIPYVERQSIEACVGQYLDLPFRCMPMERILIDVLVAMEFYAFGDEMLNNPLKQAHILWFPFIVLSLSAMVFLGLAALAIYAGSKEWIGAGWSLGIAGVLSGLFALHSIVVAVTLLWWGPAERKARQRVMNLLGHMSTVYAALQSSGPISARHIRELIDSAGTEGVIWPAPLFVLLDDIAARSGRF